MYTVRCGAIVVAAALICPSPASAQDPRGAIQQAVKPGDALTITTTDGRTIKGRFLRERDDLMVLSLGGSETQVTWSDMQRVRRRRNGIRLGAIIGAAAGFAIGIPSAMLQGTTTEGAGAMGTATAMGLGAGIAIDALLSVNRTVYDRRALTRIDVRPHNDGGALRVTVTW